MQHDVGPELADHLVAHRCGELVGRRVEHRVGPRPGRVQHVYLRGRRRGEQSLAHRQHLAWRPGLVEQDVEVDVRPAVQPAGKGST